MIHIRVTESAIEYLSEQLKAEKEEAQNVIQIALGLCEFGESKKEIPPADLSNYPAISTLRSQYGSGQNIWRRSSVRSLLLEIEQLESAAHSNVRQIPDLRARLHNAESALRSIHVRCQLFSQASEDPHGVMLLQVFHEVNMIANAAIDSLGNQTPKPPTIDPVGGVGEGRG